MGGVVSQALRGIRVTGPLNIAARDINQNVVNYYYRVESGDDIRIPYILNDVPNFREIQIATLGRATPGTGLWIVECETFRLWLDPDGWLRIMWGYGMPGAGKTIAASIIINALENHAANSTSPICVCYIYFRYSDHTKATTRTFLEVLVKQTIERHPACLPPFNGLYARHMREKTRPSEDELFGLLQQFTTSMITFYFLDALDEAPPSIQLEVIQRLASLNAKLFITSRPLKNVEDVFPDVHRFRIVAQAADIDLHINHEISRSADLCAILAEGGPSLRNEVATSIKEKCCGMFLHASLQLATLRECTNILEVRETLVTFPTDIADLYRNTWQRILALTPRKASLARNALTWVVYATRSLTIDELREAVAVCPETHKFDPGRLAQESLLIGLCHGLVAVEEETRLVRLVHYTARDILVTLLPETLPEPDALLCAICLARLTDSGLDLRHTESRSQKDPFLDYIHNAWFIHAQQSRDDPLTRSRLAEFAHAHQPFPMKLERLDYWDPARNDSLLVPLHFLAYFDLPIALAGSDQLQHPNISIQRAKTIKESSSATSSEAHSGTSPGTTALGLACERGSNVAVKELLELPGILVNEGGIYGTTPLMWAARHGRKGAVRLLLARPDIRVNAVDGGGSTALDWAAYYRHAGTAKLLLSHPDIVVNVATDGKRNTPLHHASEVGCRGIVVLLLAHPDVNINARDWDGETALSLASKGGFRGVVKLLLAHPEVEVNVEDDSGHTPLSRAAEAGMDGVVRLLLAEPSIQVGTRELEAARHGYESSRGERARILSLLEKFLTQASSH